MMALCRAGQGPPPSPTSKASILLRKCSVQKSQQRYLLDMSMGGWQHRPGTGARARGRGRADPVHYVKQGYPVSNSTVWEVFSHKYLSLLKKVLPPKMQNERYFQRFELGRSTCNQRAINPWSGFGA